MITRRNARERERKKINRHTDRDGEDICICIYIEGETKVERERVRETQTPKNYKADTSLKKSFLPDCKFASWKLTINCHVQIKEKRE